MHDEIIFKNNVLRIWGAGFVWGRGVGPGDCILAVAAQMVDGAKQCFIRLTAEQAQIVIGDLGVKIIADAACLAGLAGGDFVGIGVFDHAVFVAFMFFQPRFDPFD